MDLQDMVDEKERAISAAVQSSSETSKTNPTPLRGVVGTCTATCSYLPLPNFCFIVFLHLGRAWWVGVDKSSANLMDLFWRAFFAGCDGDATLF